MNNNSYRLIQWLCHHALGSIIIIIIVIVVVVVVVIKIIYHQKKILPVRQKIAI